MAENVDGAQELPISELTVGENNLLLVRSVLRLLPLTVYEQEEEQSKFRGSFVEDVASPILLAISYPLAAIYSPAVLNVPTNQVKRRLQALTKEIVSQRTALFAGGLMECLLAMDAFPGQQVLSARSMTAATVGNIVSGKDWLYSMEQSWQYLLASISSEDRKTFTNALQQDVKNLTNGSFSLANDPLWWKNEPPLIRRNWIKLSATLESSPAWRVWIDFYNGLLVGGAIYPQLSEEQNRQIFIQRGLHAVKALRAGATAEKLSVEILQSIEQIANSSIENLMSAEPKWLAGAPPEEAESPDEALDDQFGNQIASSVPFHFDDEAVEDQLNRRPFAEIIAEAIDELVANQKEGPRSFAVHVHGPWGTGKSSILNFMDDWLRSLNRADGRWIVVRFNAWQYEHVDPPWWPLIKSVYHQSVSQLSDWDVEPLKRGSHWWRSIYLRKYWLWWQVRANWMPYLVAVTLLAFLIAWFYPEFSGKSGKDPMYKSVEGIIKLGVLALTAVGTFAAASQAMIFGSARSAKLFNDLSSDPLRPLKRLFSKLINQTNQPVAIFIDDLDRCNERFVVQLLEGIQTLFRDARVVYVVAADRKWLTTSFESIYETFEEPIGQPGRSLGNLFVEKVFQISVAVPRMSETSKQKFWARLLTMGQGESVGIPTKKEIEEERERQRVDVNRRVDSVPDRAATREYLENHLDRVRRPTGEEWRDEIRAEIEAETVAKRAALSYATEAQATHQLTQFVDILPENPRFMKRLINSYRLHVGLGALQRKTFTPEQLVRWVVLEQSWPELADHLSAKPSDIEALRAPIEIVESEENVSSSPDYPHVVLEMAGAPTIVRIIGSEERKLFGMDDIVAVVGC